MSPGTAFACTRAVVVGAIFAAAPVARAQLSPDPVGAVDAVKSLALDAARDLIGAGGLIAASVIGIDSEVVALVDDNGLTHPLLHGIASRPTRRVALHLSRFATRALGLRARSVAGSPAERPPSKPSNGSSHLWKLRRGVGAIGLTVVDSLANTGLFVTRAIGVNEAEERLALVKTDLRIAWVGS